MTLLHRRIIYLIFMAVFLIVLPLIILSATGYRFNSKKNLLQKTGIIFLETKPKNVNVYLNSQLVEQSTPVRLKYLLPNKYEITVSKEGYFPWQKKIDVYDGQTTFLQYVRLFKNNIQPELLMPDEIIGMKKNNDDKLGLVKKNGELWFLSVYDLNSKIEKQLFESPSEIKKFEFVDNGNGILVYGADIWLVDISGGEKINLTEKIKADFKNLKVDELNSNFVFYLLKGQLFRLNLATNETSGFPYFPLDYFVRGDECYLLANDSLNNIFLKRFGLAEDKLPESLLSLPASDEYLLASVNDNFVIIRQNDKLVVWDKATGASELIKGADFYEWDSRQEELLFGNDWELWSYRPKEKDDKYILFSRTGEEIKGAFWYQPETHIFYLVADKIKIVENLISNRVTNDLMQAAEIKFAGVNKKGDKLYFVGQSGKDVGLFELDLLD
ncbi:hypothetical protein COZ84_03455 [Candidatus Kuenenbacteria bacterium CG_4_8_14_3_um_filter_39_15]|uniref:PEGA domain-containing protein n=6 Tax=Candidatus Kueneniibacteriota TaxID=1752740 RepID=A0A2M7IL04_9BACT|nr:MAG: hypothetical protein COX28_02110 [Candidatus Kuenenbacteria bacterium CG23_combo_of_CG06-09_8_20_14_all_39_39]PIP75219.1 MAG: hypothetical protein COW86_05000 [Candidatus Kuenenbacteria bacterium CG22_combo_CG10-13_8_21_14_all_39_9]PIR80722.1 MAG: hypothetical protein COU24_02455 [Candidatus Kuenenbacteria bacterium CG10_big_fil_rev_8_21_14_0_10_39_14]PIW95460.1 MAG: hypothetical protein COZ84_03455 [Candidatus Kuenenbacteria bacterium CG_4_8_14_3_um_filter_39_15]PIX92114.1 MAG: hypothe